MRNAEIAGVWKSSHSELAVEERIKANRTKEEASTSAKDTQLQASLMESRKKEQKRKEEVITDVKTKANPPAPAAAKKEEPLPVIAEEPPAVPTKVTSPPAAELLPTPVEKKPITSPSPQQLITAVTTLDSLLQDKEKLTEKVYHALKEETWKLQHVINTVSLERSKIVASAKDILSLFSAYQNEGVTMLLRNFVVERLFDKGEESRETPVALSFAYLLCELASRDAAFVSVILGQLFSKCPLLIPSLDKEADLPPVLFEKHMRRYSMLVCMFTGLFIYTPLENANPFDIALMWKWLDAFISLYLDKPFLQFSGVMEPFLAIANSLLAKSDLHRLQDVLSRLKKEIVPQLENIPSLTSGSIMRLSYHLEDYEQGVFKLPAYCTLKN